jgi:hypothetical protein
MNVTKLLGYHVSPYYTTNLKKHVAFAEFDAREVG